MRIKWPALTLAGLFGCLYGDHDGLFRLGLLASVLHEWGHVLVYRLLTGRWPRLCVDGLGIGLELGSLELPTRRELALAAAGPAVNLFLAAAGWLWVTRVKAGYYPAFFAAANLCVGVFNLLPFGGLDGRRILKLIFTAK
ncbi:MAG: peptidase [Oscillospiraceae bacterium]|nr:peptidase [Oscillospiraceae bacterium]